MANWLERQWQTGTVVCAIALIPLATVLAASMAPKRTAFYAPPPSVSGELTPDQKTARQREDQAMRATARDISGQIASAGLTCALASIRAPLVGELAIFADACEGQVRGLDVTVSRATAAISLAENRRGEPITLALKQECARDPEACQKPEVASAPAGEQ